MPQKIFVGNIKDGSTQDDLRAMFEKYGEVAECDIVSNYAFVHMVNESDAKQAVEECHNALFDGQMIRCELSTKGTQGRKRAREGMDESGYDYQDGGSWRGGGGGGGGGYFGSNRGGRSGGTQKIFVGNVKDGASSEGLRAVFEKYGEVKECDILSGFAFVHMTNESDARQAVEELHNSTFEGSLIRCELSTKDTQGRQRSREGGNYEEESFRGGRGRGRGGDFRSRPYHPYASSNGERRRPYGDPIYDDPYLGLDTDRRRDPLRDQYMRDPLLDRDPLLAIRDPYRDALLRDLYAHDVYLRDSYTRDPLRESYGREHEGKGYGRDPFARPPPEFYDRATRRDDPINDRYPAPSEGRGDLGLSRGGLDDQSDPGYGLAGFGAPGRGVGMGMRARRGRGRSGYPVRGRGEGAPRNTISGYTSFE